MRYRNPQRGRGKSKRSWRSGGGVCRVEPPRLPMGSCTGGGGLAKAKGKNPRFCAGNVGRPTVVVVGVGPGVQPVPPRPLSSSISQQPRRPRLGWGGSPVKPPAVGKGSPPVVPWAASRVGKTVSPVISLGKESEEMDRLTGNDPVSRPVGVAKLSKKVAPRDNACSRAISQICPRHVPVGRLGPACGSTH